MAQAKIQLRTVSPYHGATMVNELNAALAALGSGFAGDNDPIALGGVGPYFTWIYTGVSPAIIRRRNAGNTAWVDVGKAFVDTSKASGIAFENTASGLDAETVQAALDEIAGALAALAADDVPYSNTTSGLTATDVQAAIDEVAATAGAALPSDNASVTPTADKVPRARNDGTIDPDWLDDTDMQDKVADSIELTALNAQTTGYTLALSDRGQTVTVDSATPVTVTVPDEATVAFPVGTVVFVLQIGAGVVTIEGDTGVTINGVSAGSVDILEQWQGAVLTKTGADVWVISGAVL